MISFCFRSKFICLYEHILQFYKLWYCDLLRITLLETKMDPIRFHPESIDRLPCQEFMRGFVFAIVVLLSNYDVHLLSFIFEISWQGIYLKYEEIYVYTSRDLCHEVLLLSHYDISAACFIGHFSSLMQPWYWGIPPSLRLSSLGFDFFYIGRYTGAYPLCRSYPIFFIIFIGVQSHHFHMRSEPSFS